MFERSFRRFAVGICLEKLGVFPWEKTLRGKALAYHRVFIYITDVDSRTLIDDIKYAPKFSGQISCNTNKFCTHWNSGTGK